MKTLIVKLTKREVKILESKREKEKLSKRMRDRIEILLQCHRGLKEAEIANFLDITLDTIWRTKKKYIEGGIKNALEEKERTGQPKKYNTTHETELVAIACSDAPKGNARWTIELLRRYMRKEVKGCEQINRESIRLMLKGNECKPWIKKNVVYR